MKERDAQILTAFELQAEAYAPLMKPSDQFPADDLLIRLRYVGSLRLQVIDALRTGDRVAARGHLNEIVARNARV